MLTVLSMVGVVAAAMSGAIAAGKERMDLFGVLMVAAVTALGGGTIRDVLLNNYPLIWVNDPYYVIVVVVSAVLTVTLARLIKYVRQMFLVLDAVGLVAFSILGAQVALLKDTGVIVAAVAAVVTGAAGGILRDLLCDRIPLVFREELYASVCLVAGLGYVMLVTAGVSTGPAVAITLLVGIVLRVAAIRYKIKLPVFEYQETYYDNRQAVRWMLRELRLRWPRRSEPSAPMPKTRQPGLSDNS